MDSQAPQSTPSPLHFMETSFAYQKTAVLKAAVELGVFTAIAESDGTYQDVAKKCNTSERGMRILCDGLVTNGFVTKEGTKYRLTPDSAMFLDRRSPAYVGNALEFLLNPMMTQGFDHLAEAVRKGGSILPEQGPLAPEHPIWVQFARAMAPLMAFPAQLLAKLVDPDAGSRKLLDIAAGHAMFGIAFAKNNPKVEIFAADWRNVLQVATENAATAGVAERHHLIPGSAFEVDFESGYDIALITNFLHHFDVATCENFLKKIHAALSTGGRAVIFEFIPEENRVAPPLSARFSLAMLVMTPSGDAYTFSEYQRMLRNAGFSSIEIHPLPPAVQQVIIAHK